MLQIHFMNTTSKIALRGMPQNIFDDKSALVQVWLDEVRQQIVIWANVDPRVYLNRRWIGMRTFIPLLYM